MFRNIEWEIKFELFHVYMWIAKDFAWASNNYYLGIVAGTSALIWCFILLGFAIYRSDWEDLYMLCAITLWLGGNYVWMCGELTQPLVPYSDDGIPFFGTNNENTLISFHMFVTALSFLALYYLVLRPLGLFADSKYVTAFYNRRGFTPRFPSYFKNMKQYEYIHTLCWIGKDMSWNRLWPVPWCIFFFFTFSIALDFIYLSYKKKYWIDCAHYTAQTLWVLANFAWGYGEQFFPQYDSSLPIWVHNHLALITGRWWSQVTLVSSYSPILVLYAWLAYMWYTDNKNADNLQDSVNFIAKYKNRLLSRSSRVESESSDAVSPGRWELNPMQSIQSVQSMQSIPEIRPRALSHSIRLGSESSQVPSLARAPSLGRTERDTLRSVSLSVHEEL